MKKLLIIIALVIAGCSDDDVKPESPACKSNTQLYENLKKEIEVYRVTPGADRAILADMRKQLEGLLQLKNQTCN